MIKLTVDNRDIEVREGETLLQACLDNGIYIPNLCHIKDLKKPSASCRLCFVEIEGEDKPLTSCTVQVRDGMVVKTDTQPVIQLQRTALRLLLSVHHVDCGHCPANKRCELQRLAKILKVGLKTKHLGKHLKETEIDETHPCMNYYPNRCVLCGKCVYMCKEKQDEPLLTFARRGMDTVISFYGENDISTIPCEKCQACVDICPVSAITLKISPLT
ncbi:2Fe-2S iron-sulfur cluster-binding protein [Thermodesulfobacteriota bacterium]